MLRKDYGLGFKTRAIRRSPGAQKRMKGNEEDR